MNKYFDVSSVTKKVLMSIYTCPQVLIDKYNNMFTIRKVRHLKRTILDV